MIDTKKIIKGKVIRIEPSFIIVSFAGHQGICHISEISDYHVSDIHRYVKLNETYPFLLINADETANKYRLSFKQIRPKLLKHHREIIDSIQGFKNLYEATLKALEK
ncbi:MAG: S1 RNA-binding domain-containing protein [Mycoplasmataceae bacterium]|jgi:predicted RNA-binding protein with RPS1 domain|nr:S1 RNA-binding domain-containing protein [Mycoplasmataceae bacterium]